MCMHFGAGKSTHSFFFFKLNDQFMFYIHLVSCINVDSFITVM